jgi:hypothetical protein
MTIHFVCDYPGCLEDLNGDEAYLVTVEQPEFPEGDEEFADIELVYCEKHIAMFDPLFPERLQYEKPEEVAP